MYNNEPGLGYIYANTVIKYFKSFMKERICKCQNTALILLLSLDWSTGASKTGKMVMSYLPGYSYTALLFPLPGTEQK